MKVLSINIFTQQYNAKKETQKFSNYPNLAPLKFDTVSFGADFPDGYQSEPWCELGTLEMKQIPKRVRNIITKYISEQYSSQARFDVLDDLSNIENDLRRHSNIENKLLIPLVEKIEKAK